VTSWPRRILQDGAEYYSKVISEKGPSLDNVVGLFDGTAVEIARPGGPNRKLLIVA
jgi:hypothetical protein